MKRHLIIFALCVTVSSNCMAVGITNDTIQKVNLHYLSPSWTWNYKKDKQSPIWAYLNREAEKGDINAMFELGIYYYNSIGLESDKKMRDNAQYWLQKAAVKGHYKASFLLGEGYDYGTFGSDFEKAFYWYKMAAEQGYDRAQFKVGQCCFRWTILGKTPEEGVYWLQKAIDQGNNDAMKFLQNILKLHPEYAQHRATITLQDFASETSEPTVVLRAGIKSDSQISEVKVVLNGAEVTAADRGADVVRNDGYDMTIERRLTLRTGDNLLRITVKNAAGLATEERTISCQARNVPELEWRNGVMATDDSRYHLEMGVRSKSYVSEVRVMLNGAEVAAADRGADVVRNDGYDQLIDRYLTLREGSNTIRVDVKNADGTATAERTVTYAAKKVEPVVRERRIALVIGNAEYTGTSFKPLGNPVNDAKVMYGKLESLGFDMRPLVLNANRRRMWNAIEEFICKIKNRKYDVALIYYSGHGMSPYNGANFLIPVGAEVDYLDEVSREGINSQTELIEKLDSIKDCRVKIALLDCCNSCNVPERGAKNAVCRGGLSPYKLPSFGISIVHAAHPGKIAWDNVESSKNSPFVDAFVKCVDKYADYPWQLFITELTNTVDNMTKGAQIPYPEGQLRGQYFYLNPTHK